jgi:hypothetical protein
MADRIFREKDGWSLGSDGVQAAKGQGSMEGDFVCAIGAGDIGAVYA